jgi:GDP-mannose 6-dehydrogenase
LGAVPETDSARRRETLRFSHHVSSFPAFVRISIFGLGYVGAVTAGCLTEQGHHVIGVDVHPQKVEEFNRGQPPILEPGLDALLEQAHQKGLLLATQNCAEAVSGSDVSLICVGTPSQPNGGLDLSHVRQVIAQIAEVLRRQPKKHLLILRSTMLPGSTQRLVEELLSDLAAGGQLQVFYYPEFLRESTAVADFREPSLAVVGTRDGQSFPSELTALFGEKPAVVNWNTAEMVKYACNAFHAAKITFANEIGRLGKQMQIDSQAVMKLLCQDTRLNLSSYYLRPGNPFGGSCLPKDVRALTHYGRQHGLNLPVLENLLPSNQQHLQHLLNLITERRHSEIVILGLSFKSDTDDLRESAMVEVAQSLLGRGYALRIYDPQLNLTRMVGSNKRMIDEKMPHLAMLLHQDLGSALGGRGLVLVAQRCVSITDLAKQVTPNHHVVDINGWPELRSLSASYEGFCW